MSGWRTEAQRLLGGKEPELTQKHSSITVLALTGAIGVATLLGQWLPAILFAIAAVAFLIAAIMRARTFQVPEQTNGSTATAHIKRSPEEIRRVREYREQHPAATILEAVQAVEDQR
ncbi:MAG: hypothetical protein Q4P15_12040 [Propionibacteriaceae bacterium]|nr:hypothetical protein [Propionibacteriaceae bacterium]